MTNSPEETMAPTQDDKALPELSQAEFHELLQEKIRLAIRVTFMTVLEEEISAYIRAEPYQRTWKRRDHRNGYYTRDLGTSMGQIEALPVPRTRKKFETKVFKRYKRRQEELDGAICDMFVKGVSTVQVGNIVEGLSGIKPSASTVSRVFHTLEGEFESWKRRKLEAHYLYAFADGTYFTVIYAEEGCKMPILAVIGITTDGKRDVLGFTVGEKENQMAWEDLLQDLQDRGVAQVDLWITDGHQAMINAIEAKFPSAKRQRCVKHKMENVLSYVPKKQQDQIKPQLRAIFYQDSREQADQEVLAFCQKYEKLYPSAVACLHRDLEACLTFYAFPKKHWRTIRTTNVIERLFLEVKKRSKKMAAAFRNEESCLLLFYAVIRGLKFRRISVASK
jgi:transposase-like protein